jgi:hypothetical protein
MNRIDRRALAAILALAAFILPMAIHAATFDRSYANHVPIVEDRRTVPTIPAGTEQMPTTTVSIDSPEPTFADRLEDRAESGGGEYLPMNPPFELDAPATTIVEVIADRVESTTTTVEDWTDEGTVSDDTLPPLAEVPPAEYLPAGADIVVIGANPPAYLPACTDDERGPGFDSVDCYWDATVRGNGQGDSYFQWNGTAYAYDPAATIVD